MTLCVWPRQPNHVIFWRIRWCTIYIQGRIQCQYWLCESSDFPRFCWKFPDIFPISLPYFPILCKLDNLTLWNHNFHMVCIHPYLNLIDKKFGSDKWDFIWVSHFRSWLFFCSMRIINIFFLISARVPFERRLLEF